MSESPRDIKIATPDHQVADTIVQRWSPYAFKAQSISDAQFASLFEAARWAPSAYNEQPWRYIAAKRDQEELFEKVWSCLMEGNQGWTKDAAVLALGVASVTFDRNGSPNRTALHDLGLASAGLVFQATTMGLYVHQMSGILPSKAASLFSVPENFEVVTGLAIGFLDDDPQRQDELAQRDRKARNRRPLNELVFGETWGAAHEAV